MPSSQIILPSPSPTESKKSVLYMGTYVHPWWIHVDVWQNQYSTVNKKKKTKNAVHWNLISSYVGWLWPHGIHNGHIKKSWWGKSILLIENLAKLCELQKYKLARNINQRRVFICPYVVWSILMDLFVQPFSQLCNWKDPDYSITFIYI